MKRAIGLVAVLVLGCGGSTDGGGGGVGGGPSVDQMEANVCEEAARLPCGWATVSDCRAELDEGSREAATAGCTAEYNSLIACADRYPLICDSGGGNEAQIGPECESTADRLDACFNGSTTAPGCAVSGGGGVGTADGGSMEYCSVECSDYSVDCQGSSGSYTCTCTTGPRQGTTFDATSCSSVDSAAAQCG